MFDLDAAAEDALLRRPFDHHARYRLAAEVVLATAGPTASVLDLGGGPGSMQAFLPQARVTATDVVAPSAWFSQAPSLVVADGARLPFADDAFDVVVSLDTLEHVQPASRTDFLTEATRVAGRWAFVVCPFGTPGVADADAALRAYVANRFGPTFPTVEILDEHLGYGHPDLSATQAVLGRAGPTAVVPSGRIDRWFAGMVAFFHLLALGDDEPVEVVQRFLNRNLYEADLADPGYRHGVLVRTAPDDQEPVDVLAPLVDRAAGDPLAAADLALLRVVLAESLTASTASAVARARAADDRADDAERRAADASARAAALAEELTALQASHDELAGFRDDVLAHPLVRLRGALRRVTRR